MDENEREQLWRKIQEAKLQQLFYKILGDQKGLLVWSKTIEKLESKLCPPKENKSLSPFNPIRFVKQEKNDLDTSKKRKRERQK